VADSRCWLWKLSATLTQKLQLVASVLRQSVSTEIEIDTANDVGQAKRLLTQTQFDIAVLDISLPKMSGEESTPLAGLELMEEVSRRPKYKKPGHIVGLTASRICTSPLSLDSITSFGV
jgi:CheY-like chemotaxis protein